MLIGIISDTHDNAVNLLKAIHVFNKKKVDVVIHCGDWVSPFMPDFCGKLKTKMISIFGNNEGDKKRFLIRQQQKGWNIEFHNKRVELKIDNKRLLVYHGDSKPLLESLIHSQKYDVVFSGHTHKALVEMHRKTLHVNPGSTCGIRDSEVVKDITIAIYDTESNTARIIFLK